MRDICVIECSFRASCHVIVFCIDDIEGGLGVDYGLHDLLCGFSIPLCGLLLDDGPAERISGALECAGAADLCSGAHLALEVNDLVLVEVLTLQPLNSGFAFLRHIGNDGGFIHALVSVDNTVKEDDLHACILCILENGFPACGSCSGKQEIIDLILDVFLCCIDLLFVLFTVSKLCIEAVFLGECCLQIVVVCSTVAGFVRVVVDDADLDEFAASAVVAGIGSLAGRVSAACQSSAAEHCRENDGQDSFRFHDFTPPLNDFYLQRSFRCLN